MLKNFILILAAILISGCVTTKTVVVTEYKTVDIPKHYRELQEIPSSPKPDEFSVIEKGKYTIDTAKQRDLLKAYSDELLEHIRVLRLNYRSLIRHIDNTATIVKDVKEKP